ncbi:4-alpha-glucanotransferase [Desulfacinum hydrothermale DSM 13146]|uniref:4-alpha-glucanotransferase n=1 Tax=Desulfacinum hydrothermale DSM 13146 TaxID=1121390 RepID=A0A1W1XL49_9BACT|nr:4-alpha-glucanotransferase [Desulfacinum hydrothermale]SMC24645.1 4-alpha-glucanotransferase [Desulfacinum hydrothermale DSM 13146]
MEKGDREQTLLQVLCDLAGVQTTYRDGWGREQKVRREALTAILQSLGYPAESPKDLEASIRAAFKEKWDSVVDPVQVLPQDHPAVPLVVTFPQGREDAFFRYRLRREDGREFWGEGRLEAGIPVDGAMVDGVRYEQRLFLVSAPLPPGYHDLELFLFRSGSEESHAQSLIVAPRHAYVPESLQGHQRTWGVTGQLYGLRSQNNWGMGDFSDLKALIHWAADQGAGFVGTNPLHLLFPNDPEKCSPYAPSSRKHLQPWYLDVTAVPEFGEIQRAGAPPSFQEAENRVEELRNEPWVAYWKIWSVKRRVLEELFRHFRDHHLAKDTERAHAFRAFCREMGEDLFYYGVFHALDDHFRAQDPSLWGWPLWPEPYRDRCSHQVSHFAETHPDSLAFHQYCAWNAWEQWTACGRCSMERHLAVGIYGDLPVGVDPAGLDVWMAPRLYNGQVRLGAPPDDFNVNGQEWGVVPFFPKALQEKGYGPFIQLLRANMRVTGALRLDHVMGLTRLYWIPQGASPREGAYVHYPFHDLIQIVALESLRNRCLVVGEDLGTVPEGVREAMARKKIFGCRLVLFEKDDTGRFRHADEYPELSLASFATHDLPTLEGFWSGRDLDVRQELDLFPSEEVGKKMRTARKRDRNLLLERIAPYRTETHGAPDGVLAEGSSADEATARAAALHRHLAATPAKLVAISLEDLCGETEQVNLPGTVAEHPNWRRKLSVALEDLNENRRVHLILEAVRQGRSASDP